MDNVPAPARWLSWRSALYLYVGLVVLDIWMLLVTPTLSPWHWVGFAGFVIMPLALVAMRQAGNHENTNIQPILWVLLGMQIQFSYPQLKNGFLQVLGV